MADIERRATGTVVTGVGNSLVVPLATNVADDILIAVVTNSNTASETITAPAGWTIKNNALNAADVRQVIAWKRSTGSESAPSFTVPLGRQHIGRMVSFSGCIRTGDPFDQSAINQAGVPADVITFPAITPTVVNTMVIASMSRSRDYTAVFTGTPSPTMVEALDNLATTASSNRCCVMLGYGLRTTTTVTSIEGQWSGTAGDGVAVTLNLLPELPGNNMRMLI